MIIATLIQVLVLALRGMIHANIQILRAAIVIDSKVTEAASSVVVSPKDSFFQRSIRGRSKSTKAALNLMIKAMRFLDVLIGLMFGGDLIVVVALIFILVILLIIAPMSAVGGFGGLARAGGLAAPHGPAPAPTTHHGGGVVITGNAAVPSGIKADEWNKASQTQRILANTAITAAVMPFPGSKSNDTNSGHLVYEQGDTPVGWYDCSTFISAVLESNGLTVGGKKRNGKPYNFKTDRKRNLQDYRPTSGMLSAWSGKAVGRVGQSGWKNKVLPGDIIVNGHHVVMYVGTNSKGVQLIAHAGSHRSHVWYDTLLNQSGKQVGISRLDFQERNMAGGIIARLYG